MNYQAYEFAHAVLSPWRTFAQGMKMHLQQPFNPLSFTHMGRSAAAAIDVFESVTRRYGKPEWGISSTQIQGLDVPVRIQTVVAGPFCNLIHFQRLGPVAARRKDPKVLIVAPMSGHYATLLRGTVEAMLPEHDVYVTDWVDAREVPLALGAFDFEDYVDYLIDFIHFIGPETHVLAVCQPAVPALAAAAAMAGVDDPIQPRSLILMGGPIDTRRNPTAVNRLAEEKPLSWFEQTVISPVPFPNPGFMRPVYPGFVQLTGFMTMNLERHTQAHINLFQNLVEGDCDSVRQHQTFYEEYLSVMDLTAEFYLQTVKAVFQDHSLPRGTMMHRDQRVDCSRIRRTALLTIEGERDDISGLGQTEAAQDLCSGIPADERFHYVQQGVGHYGIFNGTRWRTEIQPRIREFIRTIEHKRRLDSGNDAAAGSSPSNLGSTCVVTEPRQEPVMDWDSAVLDQKPD